MIKGASKWLGKIVSTDSSFEQFDTLEHGIRAGLINLRNTYYRKGLVSAEQIISKYCPANGAGNTSGNTAIYIQNVAFAATGNKAAFRNSTVGSELKVAHAILTQECGKSPVTMAQLTQINTTYKIF